MSSIVEKMSAGLEAAAVEIMLLREQLQFEQQENRKLRNALERIAVCVWDSKTNTTPTLAGWMQQVAREALK